MGPQKLEHELDLKPLEQKIACVTGDVHHKLSNWWWRRNEVNFAREYAEIVSSLKVKATLLVTGRCVEENLELFKALSKMPNIELGGHTYSAFKPKIIRKFFELLFWSSYGPRFYQRMDVIKTLNAFAQIGTRPVSWRTHCLASNRNTILVLNSLGFKVISDEMSTGNFFFRREIGDLFQIPITMPIDDPVLYGENKSNKLWKKNYFEVLHNEISKENVIVTQFHPICMKKLDNFKTFKSVLVTLKENDYTFLTLRELYQMLRSR